MVLEPVSVPFENQPDLLFQHRLLAFGKAHVPEDSPAATIDDESGRGIDYLVHLMGDVLFIEKDGHRKFILAGELAGLLFHVLDIDYDDTDVLTVQPGVHGLKVRELRTAGASGGAHEIDYRHSARQGIEFVGVSGERRQRESLTEWSPRQPLLPDRFIELGLLFG